MHFPPKSRIDTIQLMTKIEKQMELMENKLKESKRHSMEHRYYSIMLGIGAKQIKTLATYASANNWL